LSLTISYSYSCGRSLQVFSAKCQNIAQHGAATTDQHEIKAPVPKIKTEAQEKIPARPL